MAFDARGAASLALEADVAFAAGAGAFAFVAATGVAAAADAVVGAVAAGVVALATVGVAADSASPHSSVSATSAIPGTVRKSIASPLRKSTNQKTSDRMSVGPNIGRINSTARMMGRMHR
ncbi:MAG TPA: hypothetical protein VMJ74_17490, partial [Pseudomonadales bacterium]|nr:hypothetical protein [Pseudomonadales bacterium]